ncbi:hypothetical protein EAF04_009168 [Stromatinia cepivora]|nr:hypothetical protein EAF04_009168 [Stromatinia cepivora]
MGQDGSRISYPTRDTRPPLLPTYPAANPTRDMAQNNSHFSPFNRQACQGSGSLSSRMTGPLSTTTIDRSTALNRQEVQMFEDRPAHVGSRKRSHNDVGGTPFEEEERQVQRARVGSSSSFHQGRPERATAPQTFQDALNSLHGGRGPMTATRGRKFRYPSGNRTMHHREQERISSTFANVDPPDRWPPVNSLAGANHTVQPSTTPSLHAPNLRKRSREEDSDADSEESDGERHAKLRRRDEEQTSVSRRASPNVRTAAFRPGTGHRFPNHSMRMNPQSQISREDESQGLDITNVIENHNSEAASSPAPNDRVVIDLTLDDTDTEEEASHQATSTGREFLWDFPSDSNTGQNVDNPHSPVFESTIPSGQQTPRPPSVRGSSPEPAGPTSPQMPSSEEPQPEPTSPQWETPSSSPPSSGFDSSDADNDVTGRAYIGDRVLAVEERRLRPFELKPHPVFEFFLEVVENHPMYLLSHKPVTQPSRRIAEEYLMVGVHGDLHKVTITNEPRCNCSEGAHGLPCWHILFILKKILKVPEPLCCQSALLDDELELMLTRKIPDNYCQRRSINEQESCLICHEDLNVNENIITCCKIECGVNFHRDCVLKWAATKWEDENFSRSGSGIQCGICRQSWVFTGEEMLEAIRIGQNGHIYKTIEGYTNVAKILGIRELWFE